MKRCRSFPCKALATAVILSPAVAYANSTPELDAVSGIGSTSGQVAPRLEWVRSIGAESCVAAEDLRRLLAQVLGDDAAPMTLGDSAIEGLVSPQTEPKGWVARVRIVSSDGAIIGQRELSTRQPLCSALTAPVLLVLQMLVDPKSADRGFPKSVVEEITSQADEEAQLQSERVTSAIQPLPVLNAPAPTKVHSRAIAPRPAAPPVVTGWRLHLEPTTSLGLLPAVSVGLSAGIALVTGDDWQLALSGGYSGPAKIELTPNPYLLGGYVSVSALFAELSVCPSVVKRSVWGLNGCIGATLVRRSFDTPSLAMHADPVRYGLGPSLGAEMRVALTDNWHLHINASAALPLPRERFVYEDGHGDSHSVFMPARLFGNLGIGLGVEL